MPFYTFQCVDCGEVAEHLVRSEKKPLSCPSCLGKNLEREYRAFSVGAAKSSSSVPKSPCENCCGSGACGV